MRFRRQTPGTCQTADIAGCESAPRWRVTVTLGEEQHSVTLCETHTVIAYNGALTLGLDPYMRALTPGVDVACVDVVTDEIEDSTNPERETER